MIKPQITKEIATGYNNTQDKLIFILDVMEVDMERYDDYPSVAKKVHAYENKVEKAFNLFWKED